MDLLCMHDAGCRANAVCAGKAWLWASTWNWHMLLHFTSHWTEWVSRPLLLSKKGLSGIVGNVSDHQWDALQQTHVQHRRALEVVTTHVRLTAMSSCHHWWDTACWQRSSSVKRRSVPWHNEHSVWKQFLRSLTVKCSHCTKSAATFSNHLKYSYYLAENSFQSISQHLETFSVLFLKNRRHFCAYFVVLIDTLNHSRLLYLLCKF